MRKYRCFPCNKYFPLKELIKRNDGRHIDYVCPICEKVIICSEGTK
jgi:DNA-directed RNA polymerase subunit RPC12/RpoP